MPWLAGWLVALFAHMLLGWPFGLAGGLLAGYLAPRRGGLWGALAVGGAWAALVAYTWVVAPGPAAAMNRVMAGILGNMPEPLFVVLTVLIGALIGLGSGLAGAQAARLFRSTPARHR